MTGGAKAGQVAYHRGHEKRLRQSGPHQHPKPFFVASIDNQPGQYAQVARTQGFTD